MDELKDIWGELKETPSDLSREEILKNAHAKSAGTLEQLRKKVKAKLGYAVFFTVVIAGGIPFAFPLPSQILLSILLAAYLVGSVLLYQELSILNKGIDMSQDVLHGLTTYRDRIKRVLNYEEVVALSLYPVSASGGFLLGRQLWNRDAEIMMQATDWAVLVIAMIAITIAGHWLARWMNRVAFGKHLDELQQNIDELSRGS